MSDGSPARVELLRTQDEIAEYLAKILHLRDDRFGYARKELLKFLTPGVAQRVIGDHGHSWIPLDADRPSIEGLIVSRAPLFWLLADAKRGAGINRAVSRLRIWLWLLREEEAAREVSDWLYAKPYLASICEKFGVDWRSLDDGVWVNGPAPGCRRHRPRAVRMPWRSND